ncbi:MAG: bifunctional (p)ppGpp synthetase/guanosine-3',5'-bis(diphosphate) 3'-pyrophosphohydrolase [Nitriliruptoraceae bacterium]|nr:bifunctional (p)ppGpp synthetase/guanosine-3',5'-bis(diphosphate) 3'-pyrophosphohydrolase [Nitriliruptoraceae bacterium]
MLARLPLVQRETVPTEVEALAAAIRASSKADLREVLRAYRYAEAMHEGQRRKSGEAYITHPVAVATELATLGLGTATLIAALLHDTVEDTPATLDDVREGFGDEVVHLVDGVTKLDRLQVESKQQQQAETLRKMIVAMAKDIRVLVIKLADRLHNMETIAFMPREKQKRIAQETLDIYAPLAHRLGMQHFKLRLEDLGFQTLHPKRYDEIVAMVEERNPERASYIEDVIAAIQEQLKELKIRGEVTGRPKHYYSIYEKMVLRGKEFDEIHDLVGVRVIVTTVRDCYAFLGQLHATFRPVPGRFKDYIAMPKVNLYQSLHTSVIGPKGRPLEVQIRTRAMHQTAEFGVAAHWKYKDQARAGDDDQAEELPWIDQLLEWQEDVEEPGDYLESLKIDLYQDEVFVFTPKGDVMGLPAGATPIDFAYAVHTDVGHRCIGARVNGRLVPLDHVLLNGDKVEVLTSKAEDAGPSRDWLQLAASQRARSKIRAYFNRERREDAIGRGRDAISRALKRKGVGYSRVMASGGLADVAHVLNYKGTDALFRAVGEGHVAAATVAQHVLNDLTEVEDDVAEEETRPEDITHAPIRIGEGRGGEDVEVEGDSGMLVKLARCCTPVPGDDIIGFVTRGRGVSVHRADCSNVGDLERDPERFIPVDWSGQSTSAFLVQIQIEALDRKHLLRDITAVLGDLHINITSAQVGTRKDRVAQLKFTFELGDPSHLDYALRSIRRVEGVYDAYRVVPQAAVRR